MYCGNICAVHPLSWASPCHQSQEGLHPHNCPQHPSKRGWNDCDVSRLAGTGNALRVAQPICCQANVLLGPLADHVAKVGTTCRCCRDSTRSLDVTTEGLHIGIHQESQLLDTINLLFINNGHSHCGSTPELLESLVHRRRIHAAVVVTS